MTNSTTNIPILDDDAVGEIEARAAKASSGPWIVTDGQHIDQYGHHPDGNRLLSEGSYDANYHMFGADDIEFIAHARADIPALCQTVRALRAENARYAKVLSDRLREMESLATSFDALDAQLEQVTKERDGMREKVKSMRADYRKRAEEADREHDNVAQLILLHKATAASEIITALESVSIQEQEAKQS